MKSMDKQMELFADGGLMDEGGMVDEVSGNEVPPGSTREEVRDDIPAQLSEGEFVFPADVVRYFGLEKLMEMRQEAKMGLKRMEEMGQMGNSDEATMPDDLPFTIDDLDIEEEDEYNEVQEFAVGGAVQMPGFTGIGGYVQPPAVTTGVAPAPVAAASTPAAPAAPVTAYKPPQQQVTPVLNVPQTMPTFQGMVGFGPEGVEYETVTYVNEAGQTLVLKKNKQTGQLLDMEGNPATVPEGYKLKGAEDAVQSTTDTSTVTGQSDRGDKDSDLNATSTKVSSAKVPSFLENIFGTKETPAGFKSDKFFDVRPTDAFAGSAEFGTKSSELAKASAAQGLYQMSLIGVGGIGSALAKEFGLMDYNMKDMALAGQTGKMNALNALGYADAQQLSSIQQADLVGKAMAAAHKAAKDGQDPNKAIQDVLNSPEAKAAKIEALNNLRDQLAPSGGSYKDVADIANQLADTYTSQRSNLLSGGFDNELGGKGVVTDSSGKAVQSKDGPVMTGAGKQLKDALDAKIARTKAAASLANSVVSENLKEKIDKNYKSIETQKALADAGMADRAEQFGGYGDNDHNGGGDDGQGGSYGDDGSGLPMCLTEDMKVKLNGVIDFVTNVKVGDIVDNTRVTEVLHKHMREGYYVVNGELKITNDHPVLANGSWKRTEDLVLGDYINNVEVTSLEYVDQVTPTVYIGTAEDRYDVYTEGQVYTVHGQYENTIKKAA